MRSMGSFNHKHLQTSTYWVNKKIAGNRGGNLYIQFLSGVFVNLRLTNPINKLFMMPLLKTKHFAVKLSGLLVFSACKKKFRLGPCTCC
jgi:hypothetical protein